MITGRLDFEQYLARYGVNDIDRCARRLRDLQADRALHREISAVSPWRISATAGGFPGSNRAALAQFYNLLASPPFRYLFETQKVNHFRALVPRLLAAVGPQARVLDVGCHAGLITNYLALQRPHAHVVGLDLAGEAIALARRAAHDLHLANVEFACGDLLEVHWRQRFDLVLATSVLMDLTFGPTDEPSSDGGEDTSPAGGCLADLIALSDAELDALIESTRRITAKVRRLARAAAAGGQVVVSIDFPEGDEVEGHLADRHRALIRRALASCGFHGPTEARLPYVKYRDVLDPDTGGLLHEEVTTWLLCSGPRRPARREPLDHEGRETTRNPRKGDRPGIGDR
ncbi:MAG: methyltransferase domain-containing protein [Chloroflexi bacterium]|nr:methyltransferase domain-containing protein [Chloroflexota bacterium]